MKRFGICFLIFIFMACCEKCYAQSQYSAVLSKMENSLFGIDYNTQSDDARLARIEKTVYGQSASSPMQQRVDKLSKDLAADLMGQEIKPTTDTFAKDDDAIKEDIPKADKTVSYPVVDSLEQKVFNREFKTEDINQRLANLEQNVFKKSYSDDLSSRVDRLKTAIMPEKVANNDDNGDDETEYDGDISPYSGNNRGVKSHALGKQSFIPKNNNYFPDPDTNPALDPNNYPNFGNTGDAAPVNGLGMPDYDAYNSQMQDLAPQIPSYNARNSVLDKYQSDADIVIPLAALEKKVLRHSFPNDTVPNRLTRLELKVFNSTFFEDDELTRLDRIASAYRAQKTSQKYDSNKFQQHMSTAVELGAILLMILAAVL